MDQHQFVCSLKDPSATKKRRKHKPPGHIKQEPQHKIQQHRDRSKYHRPSEKHNAS